MKQERGGTPEGLNDAMDGWMNEWMHFQTSKGNSLNTVQYLKCFWCFYCLAILV